MKRSTDRILTTHVGSLVRAPARRPSRRPATRRAHRAGSQSVIHAGPETTQVIERNGIEHARSYGLARAADPKTLHACRRGL